MLNLVLPALLTVPCPGPQSSQPARRFITGEVLDPTGKPAAGATVRLWRFSGETLPESFQRARAGTRLSELLAAPVDAEGRFRMEAEEGRYYLVSADRSGDERVQPEVFVPAGARLVLRLLPPVTLQGQVQRTGQDPQPVKVPGATVKVQWVGDSYSGTPDPAWKRPLPEPVKTVADAEGRFSVRVPAVGPRECYYLIASATVDGKPWSATVQSRGKSEATLSLALPAPATEDAGKETALLLVDKASGKPVPGVRILDWNGDQSKESDAEGRIKVQRNAGAHVVPRRHARTAVPHDQGGGDELKLELEPGLMCKARLLREDGRPLADVLVILGGPVQRENSTWHQMSWTERTNQDGLLELHCLQSGMTLFGFVEVDGAFAAFLHATPKQDLDLGDVRIGLSGRLAGRVLGPDGAPVAGARLLIQTAGDEKGAEFPHMAWPSRAARCNAMGMFVVGALLPGKYRVAALATGLRPEYRDVVVGSNAAPLEFALVRGETVVGKVLLADGKPAAGASISSWTSSQGGDAVRFGIQPSAETDDQGRFVLGGLPAEGAVNLSVSVRSGDQWQSGQAQSVPVGTQDLEISLSTR